MPRDVIAEWRRALTRREPAYAAFAKTHDLRVPLPEPPKPGGIAVTPFDINKTRVLHATPRVTAGSGGDLAQAIRVLQRHNRLLRAKFALGWADATNFVLGEATRRGVPATPVARALVTRLRTEQSR